MSAKEKRLRNTTTATTTTNAQYTPPTRPNCQVESRRRYAHNSQLVGNSLDESEQICHCQQRSRVASCWRCEIDRDPV